INISGACFLFQFADPALRQLVQTHWGPFAVSLSEIKDVQAVLQFPDEEPALSKLKHWQSYSSEHFLFVSDGKRYLLTGYMYDHPWQFHCRALPDWNAEFIYYYIVEPILLDLLKTSGILVWHSAAVVRDGMAILLPGVSGSGKSTTTLNFLSLGYRFLADDMILLRRRDDGLEAFGYETGLYLTDKSIHLLPEWEKFKQGQKRKKGTRWKHEINLTSFRPHPKAQPPLIKAVLFPQVSKGKETRLEKLTEAQVMLECLRQPPKEFPASILGQAAIQSQFEIYSSLASSARSYKIYLGEDQDHVRAVLSGLEIDSDA
ncbi:MAG TPA: hypothetical protein VEF04_21150, partial [Blastocatellia bacterium]|nr:hypothetical protein [Blastocatellia bacterium]